MGAGKWRDGCAVTLIGASVVVLPDNDEPGRKHACEVAQSLRRAGVEVRIVELPGLPPKGDVSDWLAAGGTTDELQALARERPPFDSAAVEVPDEPEIGVCVADVKRETVRWLWLGRLALGKLTILDGDPGLGKSTLYCDLAARITTGRGWPDAEDAASEPGSVVIVTTEDGVADTIRPRLEEAGADLARVRVVQTIPEPDGTARVPTLPDDIPVLLRVCERMGARLLVIDPLFAHLGAETNSYRDQDVRRALAPLAEAAERAGVAVLVIRHPNKAIGGPAMYRGGGSIGIIGAARVGLFAGRDPDDEGRVVLACTKDNLAVHPPSLAFRLVPSANDAGTAVVRWEGTSPLTANDLARPVRPTTARGEAEQWLRALLVDGSRPSSDVFELGAEAGHSKRTLYRAKDALGVEARKVGFGGGWEWALPSVPDGPKMPEDVHVRSWQPSVIFGGDGADGGLPVSLRVGQTVMTPQGPGVVTREPEDGRVGVEVDGMPGSYSLDAIARREKG